MISDRCGFFSWHARGIRQTGDCTLPVWRESCPWAASISALDDQDSHPRTVAQTAKKHTDKRHRVYFVVIIVVRTACVSPVFAFYITFLAASNGTE